MLELLISFLIFVLVVLVIAYVVVFALLLFPGMPPQVSRIVWMIAALIVVVRLIEILPTLLRFA